MRQIAGVFAQLEKARLVAKLKAARDRKRAAGLKVEGRKSYREIDEEKHGGKMIAMARRLRWKMPKGGADRLELSPMNWREQATRARAGSHTRRPPSDECWERSNDRTQDRFGALTSTS